MTRHIPRLLVTGALLFPATLYALGLGEIHLNSALSQPFDAEVELLSPTQEELNGLKVGLASAESFARSGIDRASYLSNFTFKVVSIGDGRAVVRMTSTKAVTEPVVSLLLEATSPRGRWVREYTVFLDPPVFVPVQPTPQVAQDNRTTAPPPVEAPRNEGVIERTPQPVETPPAVTPSAETRPPEQAVVPPPVTTTPTPPPVEPVPAEPIPTQPSVVPTPSATVAADSYDVQRNDSLWRIASRLRPGNAKSINQTMVALYRANPAAFAGNMNRLRSGAVLRVPASDAIEATDTREATAEVTRQFNEWRPATPAVIEEPATPVDPDRGHLRLVTPTEPAAPVETAATRAAAQAKVVEAAKEAEAAKREADKVAAAESKQRADAEAKRLLDLKNADLARAQQAAAAAAEAKAKAEADAKAKAAADAKAKTDAQAKADADAKAAKTTEPAVQPAPAETPPETPPVETKAETRKPAVQKPAAEPAKPEGGSIGDTLANLPWTYILGGLGIVALLGALLWRSRRRPEDHRSLHFPMADASVPTMTQADFDAAISEEPVAVAPQKRQSYTVASTPLEEQYDEGMDIGGAGPDSFADVEGTKPLHDSGAPAEIPRSGRALDETMSSETAVHVDQQDAVAEADFHMAYGLYDQAADLVKIALGREPKRRDLKLKLLEIYFVWGNKDLFLETAKDLFTTRDQAPQGEWDKIVIMGKQIAPQDPLFQGTSISAAGDLLDVNLEGGENRVDFDLFSTPEVENATSSANSKLDFEIGNTGSRQKPSHLDFLLDDLGSAAIADDDTREMDSNARTQETPTIESPVLDRRSDETAREPVLDLNFGNDIPPSERTAELSIDDLGLDVGSLESTGSLERTTALTGGRGSAHDDSIADDEMTRIAPASAEMAAKLRQAQANTEPTMEVPRYEPEARTSKASTKEVEHDGSGTDVGISTIYLEQLETSSGEVVDSMGPRSDETAHMLGPNDLDIDLDNFGADDSTGDTARRKAMRPDANDATAEMPSRMAADTAATAEHVRPKMDSDILIGTGGHPEMEPVTMSEVGTKLDLARAYMDMGDPDGARSILEEVLGEGNSGQRAEAQRLLDSIR